MRYPWILLKRSKQIQFLSVRHLKATLKLLLSFLALTVSVFCVSCCLFVQPAATLACCCWFIWISSENFTQTSAFCYIFSFRFISLGTFKNMIVSPNLQIFLFFFQFLFYFFLQSQHRKREKINIENIFELVSHSFAAIHVSDLTFRLNLALVIKWITFDSPQGVCAICRQNGSLAFKKRHRRAFWFFPRTQCTDFGPRPTRTQDLIGQQGKICNVGHVRWMQKWQKVEKRRMKSEKFASGKRDSRVENVLDLVLPIANYVP